MAYKPKNLNKKTNYKKNDQRSVKAEKKIVRARNKWNQKQKTAITEYLFKTATILKLQDWKIKVKWDKFCDEFDDAYATNTPVGDSRHCEIRFSERFLELDDSEMTQAVVHELLHCYYFPAEDYTEEMFSKATDEKSAELFSIGYTKLMETAIDGVADGIATIVPQFKLPDRNKLKK
jgi:hypothetical protein